MQIGVAHARIIVRIALRCPILEASLIWFTAQDSTVQIRHKHAASLTRRPVPNTIVRALRRSPERCARLITTRIKIEICDVNCKWLESKARWAWIWLTTRLCNGFAIAQAPPLVTSSPSCRGCRFTIEGGGRSVGGIVPTPIARCVQRGHHRDAGAALVGGTICSEMSDDFRHFSRTVNFT
jgi:hypothetical protein